MGIKGVHRMDYKRGTKSYVLNELHCMIQDMDNEDDFDKNHFDVDHAYGMIEIVRDTDEDSGWSLLGKVTATVAGGAVFMTGIVTLIIAFIKWAAS